MQGGLSYEAGLRTDSAGNSVLHGVERSYARSGHLHKEQHYEMGTPVGEWLRFDDRTGRLLSSATYSDGIRRELRDFAADGSVERERMYDTEGNETEYKTYYADGTLREAVELRDGQPDGMTRRYDPQGHLSETIPYQAGLESGTRTSYYPGSEQPRTVTEMKSGKAHGRSASYTPDGQLISERWYLDGEQASEQEFRVGKLHIAQAVDLGDGPPEYHGQPYWNMQIPAEAVASVSAGATLYHLDGQLIGRREWHDEASAVVNIEEVWIPGVLKTGAVRYFKPDKALMHCAYYLNGKQVGADVFINYEGVLMRENYYIDGEKVTRESYERSPLANLLPPADHWRGLQHP
jgi:antitoxin component YwqK of YwqJK toxin-antitoxin module